MTGTWGYSGVRCKIKPGVFGAGREGDAIVYFDHKRLGQHWITVLWDDEEDPECFKASCLLIKTLKDDKFKPYSP
jgi:hypothetical protein